MSSTNTTAPCDDSGDAVSRAEVFVAALTFFSLMVCGICSLVYCFALLREKRAQEEAEANGTSQESEEERIRERKEAISNELNATEWVPDDPPVESTEGDQDTPTSGEKTVEVPEPPVPPINSTPASCAIGSDDCESFVAGEEEMAGCAICLSPFESQQLVCESNNSACQHVFHKECMVDWLTKHQDTCPMCREVYILKTV
jgi:hypothetical protein